MTLYEFVSQNQSVLLYAIVAFVVYCGAVYVKELILAKMKQEKPGTRKGCAECLAMQATLTRLPVIEKNQADLRSKGIPELTECISTLDTSVQSLKGDVSKLFSLIEQSWLSQINRLETALHASIISSPASKIKPSGKGKRHVGKGKKSVGRKVAERIQRCRSRG